MSRITADDLRVLVVVAEEGGFSAAARRMGLSQPTVSRTVARLESAVGVPLAARTTRSVHLTPAGRVLVREGRLALARLEAAVEVTRRSLTAAGRLVVAVKPDGDGDLLRSLVPRLEALGQPVDLLLRETHLVADAVRHGTADVGLVSGPVDLQDLDHEVVLVERRVTVVGRGHHLAGRHVVDLADLEGEPVARWPHLPRALDRYYQGLGGDTERPTPGPAVADLNEVLRMVELGRAVTFLPLGLVRRFVGRDFVALTTRGLSDSVIRAVWRAESRDLAVARLLEHAHECAAQA